MMSFDPTQQPPLGQGPDSTYGAASDTTSADYSQPLYSAPQGPYDPDDRHAQRPHHPSGTPQATPLPLSEAFGQLFGQYWKIITRPGPTTFAQEMGKAQWGILWLQLIAYTLLASILSFLHNQLYPVVFPVLYASDASGTTSVDLSFLQGPINFIEGPGASFVILLGFFIFQAFVFAVAKALRGTGTFPAQAYTTLLCQVPLGLITAVFAFIPLLGALIGITASIYEIVLNIFAMMAVHRVGGGKATAILLIPFSTLLLLACGALFLVINSAVQHISPDIHGF
jgi:hypothetical protein